MHIVIVSFPDQIFCTRPVALSINRVWTHSLVVYTGKIIYQHVVVPIKLLREVNYVDMSLQIASLQIFGNLLIILLEPIG